MGSEGRGLSFNYRSDITMITGTFGKAFGSGGAFLASNSEIGEYLIQTSGAFRYTTALAPSLAAGALEGLRKILENKEWGKDLLSSAKVWKGEIIRNFIFPVQGDSHILSIIIGKEEKAIDLQKYLEKNGFLAIAIRPPTVPVGQSRIRITIRRDLDFNLLKNFIAVLKEFK
jgi:8-amino-7-oxononanoate synthase